MEKTSSILGMLLTLLATSCGSDDSGPRVRVVLVTLDTLRYDSFDGEGGSTTMPRLREFAAEGRTFRRHYAATSVTQPTHASLLTGLSPWQHGVPANGMALPDWNLTLAEEFSAAGFATGAVVSSFPLEERYGFDQGFDDYVDDFDAGHSTEWNEEQVDGTRFYSLADAVTARALALVENAGDGDQFFWFHYFDPHGPYGDTASDAPYTQAHALLAARDRPAELPRVLAETRDRYDADVRFLDRYLGVLVDAIEDDPGWVTHWIFVSDHGESFGEGGSVGHGKRVTREQIHVPCIVRSPAIEPGVSDVPTGSADVARWARFLGGLTEEESPLLTDGESAGRPRVSGMRRTWSEPVKEGRLDGRSYTIAGLRFFVVGGDGERILYGNQRQVLCSDGRRVSDLESASVAELFGEFEDELGRSEGREVLDPEALARMRELGYAR